jgi:hypothetical protein
MLNGLDPSCVSTDVPALLLRFYLPCTLQERDTEAAELVQQVERLTADKQRMEQECEDTKVCAQSVNVGAQVVCLQTTCLPT